VQGGANKKIPEQTAAGEGVRNKGGGSAVGRQKQRSPTGLKMYSDLDVPLEATVNIRKRGNPTTRRDAAGTGRRKIT